MALTKISRSLLDTGVSDSSDATAITIDSSENVGIGVTSLSQKLEVSGNVGITDNLGIGTGSSSPNSRLQIKKDGTGNYANQTFTNADSTAGITFGIAGSGTGNYLANNAFLLNTGSSAFIFGTADTERMRIDSSGALVVGGTTADGADTITLHQGGFMGVRQTGSEAMELRRDSSDGTILQFRKDGTLVGTISTNANSLPSDRNFKRDISDLNLGLDLVTKLKPSQYCYKVSDEDSPKMYGLIAQDLEESLTEVGIEKNSTWLLQHNPKEDVNESDYSLDYTKLIPILINSIQEQQDIIDDLKLRIETLEG